MLKDGWKSLELNQFGGNKFKRPWEITPKKSSAANSATALPCPNGASCVLYWPESGNTLFLQISGSLKKGPTSAIGRDWLGWRGSPGWPLPHPDPISNLVCISSGSGTSVPIQAHQEIAQTDLRIFRPALSRDCRLDGHAQLSSLPSRDLSTVGTI